MRSLRTLPLRLEVAEGESADSWLEALARRYRTSPGAMLPFLGIHPANNISALLGTTDPGMWDRAAQAAGLDTARLRSAAGLDLALITRLGGTRFCPHCLAETGGRWQLMWRLNWAVACRVHRIVLSEGCPACREQLRTRIAGGNKPVRPGTCTNMLDGSRRCGADLTVVQPVVADDSSLEVQRWIEDLAAELCGPDPAKAAALFADLPAVTSWLARAMPTGWEERGRRGRGTVPGADATQTAHLLTQARAVLTADDETAIQILKQATAAQQTGWRNPPPGMGHFRWHALGPVFPNRYLRAADLDLQAIDRLRMRTVTSGAARASPGTAGRAPALPQLLWPEWTARLLPPAGFLVEQFRAVMSACVLIPGSPQRSLAAIAAPLNPQLGRGWVSVALQRLADIDGEASLRPVLVALCRLADYLDEHGSAIDYRRRREIAAGLTMTWSSWRDLACGAGGHPGDPMPTGRLLHAQRYLHQLLTGSDLADPAHALTLRGAADRTRYLTFIAGLSTPLRRALYQQAEQFLAVRGIDEPVTWRPPLDLADGLDLPGIDLDRIDLALIKRVVIDEAQPPTAAATQLGIHVEHVRIALERLDRPERTWTYRGKPEAWKREQVLTREYFEREYIRARRSLRQIGEELQLDRSTISLYARRHGIETDQGQRRRTPIDEAWLREQYLGRQRSTFDIAQEAGVAQMTVARALERAGVALRTPGIASHSDMIATLDRRLAPDVRAAAEGKLHGWRRLRRFQIAMNLPSLDETGRHLSAHQSGLTAQLQRLEKDIGKLLYHRSAIGRPHAPTPRGGKLLEALERPLAQAHMSQALGPDLEPMPDQATIKAAFARFNTPQKKRGPKPLTPFGDIAVERIHIGSATLRLLQDLLTHDDQQFYGDEIVKRAGIDAGTLYPALRRLRDARWLTSWPEPEQEWLAGAPPGRGPGRRRTYYALTPEGRRAAEHEIAHRAERPKKAGRT